MKGGSPTEIYLVWNDSDGGYDSDLVAVVSTKEAAEALVAVSPRDSAPGQSGDGRWMEKVIVDQPYGR